MLAHLLGSQHLFEILQTSLTFKNSENGVKADVLKNIWRGSIFFEIDGYKASCVKILMFWYITSRLVFIWTVKTSKIVVKSECFKKQLRWRTYSFSNEGGVQGILCKKIFLADLLGSQHLLEILQASHNFKNSENVVRVDVSKNACN